MADQNFIESDISFSFDSDWTVKKYDEHAYFRILSGHGLKGVDFIGIYKQQSLYLIEVKNYHQRSYSPVAPDWSDITGTNPNLASAFNEKIKDTLQLIDVVILYLSRRWWSKPALTLHRLLGSTKLTKDWQFWTKVKSLTEDSSQVHPILYLALPPAFLHQEQTTATQYLQHLASTIHTQSTNPNPNTRITSAHQSSIKNNSLPGVTII